VIFSRRGGGGRHSRDEAGRERGRHSAKRRERDEFGVDGDSDTDGLDLDPDTEAALTAAAGGPYDVDSAPNDGLTRLDLGSLYIPAIDGVEVRLQASPEGQVAAVELVHEDSAPQRGAFAAPRSEGIWDDVRAEIAGSLSADGAVVSEVDGPYGVEMRAEVKGPQGAAVIRFVGVDGPRWFVRAIYEGRAAVDPTAAPPLDECLRGLIVDRGHEARPVREMLPLRLPKEFAEQARAQQEQAEAAEAAAATPPAAEPEPPNGRPAAGGSGGAGGTRPRRKPSPRPRRKADGG